MKKVFLILLMIAIRLLSDDVRLVNSIGFGTTPDEAIKNAKKNAVEMCLGTYISSESIVANYITVQDRILSKSSGFVKNFRTISKPILKDGFYETEIEASVLNVMDKVLEDKYAIQFLMEQMSFPDFGIAVINTENKRESTAESALIKQFINAGFSSFKIIRSDPGDFKSIKNESIEFYIRGKVEYELEEMPNNGLSVYKKMQKIIITLECDLIDLNTSQIIATESFTIESVGVNEKNTIQNGMKKIAKKMTKYLVLNSVEFWANDLSK
ncbi:MAG: hypothetical protein JXR69_03300 [Candidatus Delongbacteria bacterium]|nr:hypothetical protein [Candidatus Delongbacteria bacterium]